LPPSDFVPRDNANSLLHAVQWVTEARAAKWRHDRAMAFMFATLGPRAFPGCETIADVCAQVDLSERTMHAHLEALRTAYAIRPPASLPSDVIPRVSDDFAADEESEAA
jgi:hypothetical protein